MQVEIYRPYKIKQKEEQGNQWIIDAVFEKRIGCSSKKTEVAAKQDKSGDVPAHDEDRHCCTHKRCAEKVHIPKVFRRQVEWIDAECFHKRAVNRTEEDEPEYDQHLEFAEMKQK